MNKYICFQEQIGDMLIRKHYSELEKQDLFSISKKKSNNEILDDEMIQEIIGIQKPKYMMLRNHLVGP